MYSYSALSPWQTYLPCTDIIRDGKWIKKCCCYLSKVHTQEMGCAVNHKSLIKLISGGTVNGDFSDAYSVKIMHNYLQRYLHLCIYVPAPVVMPVCKTFWRFFFVLLWCLHLKTLCLEDHLEGRMTLHLQKIWETLSACVPNRQLEPFGTEPLNLIHI